MPELIFVTGNTQKFDVAVKVFAAYGVRLHQTKLDIDEIQGEDPERIIIDKLNKAYAATQKPVIVNDDSWSFEGLGGFPGPYMKSIVHWFTPEDFLHLTLPLANRRVILTQWLGYQDANVQKLFRFAYNGTVLTELRGTSGLSLHKIISMPGDRGSSIAESYDNGVDTTTREVAKGWRHLAEWYKQEIL